MNIYKILGLLVTIILANWPGYGYSQDYSLRISTFEDEFPAGSLSDLNNGIYSIVVRGQFELDPTPADFFHNYRNTIYHINDQGEIIDDIEIDKIDGYDLLLKSIIRTGDSLMVWGNAYRPEDESYSLVILYFNSNMQLLGINIPYTSDSIIEFFCYTAVDQDNLVFSACKGEYGWDQLLVKTSRTGNFIQERLNPGFAGPWPNIGYLPSVDQILCGRYHWLGYIDNTDFTIDSVYYPLSIDLLSYGFFRPYDSSHCIIPSQFYNWDATTDPGYFVIDTIAQATDTALFDLRPDQNEAIDIDYLTVDTMFLGAIENSYMPEPNKGFNPVDRWFAVIKFSKDGEIIWENRFGGEANYILYDITAMQDGSCVMLGTYYDWRNNTMMERDVMIIKSTPDGLYTGLAGHQSPEVQIFPNPANERLFVRISGNSTSSYVIDEITVSDMTGKIWSTSGVNHEKEIMVDVSGYPPGVYYISLLSGNQFLLGKKTVIF